MKSEKKETGQSAKVLRQKKFLMILPVLVLPFLTLLLWTLGIVGNVNAVAGNKQSVAGLNLSLPAAAPAKDSTWNKMKYYEQADRDSAKMRSYLKSDPYRKLELEVKAQHSSFDTIEMNENKETTSRRKKFSHEPYPSENKRDVNEEKVFKKLEALNRELERTGEPKKNVAKKIVIEEHNLLPENPDVARLEAMMQTMQAASSENKELSQINQMLDKIVRIQNPGTGIVMDSLQEESAKNKKEVFTVHAPKENIISILESPDKYFFYKDSLLENALEMNRFYSLDEEAKNESTIQAIPAIIQEDQTLVSGSTVKLSILNEMYIGGVHIPKDQLIYGIATLTGERLTIKISSIAYADHLLPVSLTVYDADGIAGIHVPGAITRDVAKRSAAQSVQNLGTISTLDPSFGTQIATAGLQAAQNLIGKSAKLVRVHLKTGYRVLLRDDNRKDK